MHVERLEPEFVLSIPDPMKDGVLYVSMEFSTAGHNCCCGCGGQVFTPFTPHDWQLKFDGEISVWPSIGNGSFSCRSHYFINNNRIAWLPPLKRQEIAKARRLDGIAKRNEVGRKAHAPALKDEGGLKKKTFWQSLFGS